ncbi:methyltransferase, FxLD system [Saccharopolyspora sp. SCSIO 74807]|uniref:methyltransferase, FxLD system n=1 Tax=Saccharopolyspora sp. SCSIO 74807 TaxID=3118084 RepID=UPI0030D07BE0
MTWNDEDLLTTNDQGPWWQATIAFPDPSGISPEAATALAAGLEGQRFHFLRKEGKLRLRFEKPAADVLDRLVADQHATGWVPGIYEPEVEAFGGAEGMAIAHELFCADSPAALAATGDSRNRERCILLLSTLHRAAGLDPFEIGDVWSRLAALRPVIPPPDEHAQGPQLAAMRRLMHADAAQRETTENRWSERVAAFAAAGSALADLASTGRLTRGLRAVLAHHAIFAFNRAGTPPADQAAVAWLAQHTTFGTDVSTTVSHSETPSPAPNLPRMNNMITTDPAELREEFVTRLTASGHLHSQDIIDAFRAVERHTFVPDADLASAYGEGTVSVKDAPDDGETLSCISAPSIVATQLEQLAPQPGHRVLEAGAATGYNAALLGRLVGPGGHVWTVDVDEDLVAGASTNLASVGIENVTVLLGDGAAGLADQAPFDRIQFTVGAGDIPTHVLDQLAPGGRLVIPMRIRGSISRSFAFEREANGLTWKTVSCEMATFIPLRKGVADDIRTVVHHDGPGDVHLETYTEQEVDREAMRSILDQPSHKIYTGMRLRQGFSWEWVYLHLACTLTNGLSRMPGQRPGFTPHFAWGSMAALDGDSLAYLTIREGDDEDGRYWEPGVIGHGPRATELANQVATEFATWARERGNDAPEPGFRMATDAHRDLLEAADPRFVIDKPHSRLVIDWR